MAVDKGRILITECYSPRNLGDAELVSATLDVVDALAFSEKSELVALDVEQFRILYPSRVVHPRLFDRREYGSSSAGRKLVILAGWSWFILMQSLVVVTMPKRCRRAMAHRLLPLFREAMRETAQAYCESQAVFAVGGGYLGDRYFKESCLTAWTWWWSARTGSQVTTMPISVEAKGRLLKYVFTLFLQYVKISVRDDSSKRLLEALGIRSTRVPDLAFRNTAQSRIGSANRESAGGRKNPKMLIVPVGGDYFDDNLWQEKLKMLADVILTDYPTWDVALLSMHLSLEGATAGFDDEAVNYMESLLPDATVLNRVAVRNYSDLCSKIHCEIDLVISARMHAGIAALCSAVPLVMFGYEEKHRSLMTFLGLQNQFADFADLDRSTASDLIATALTVSSESLQEIADQQSRNLADWKIW